METGENENPSVNQNQLSTGKKCAGAVCGGFTLIVLIVAIVLIGKNAFIYDVLV